MPDVYISNSYGTATEDPTPLLFGQTTPTSTATLERPSVVVRNDQRQPQIHSSSPAWSTMEAATYQIPTAEATQTTGLQQQLEFVRRQRDSLLEQLNEVKERTDGYIADVAASLVAVFLLSRVAAQGRIDIEVLSESLVAPSGWLAFARLWRANLIDCLGNQVIPTAAGAELLALVDRARSANGTLRPAH